MAIDGDSNQRIEDVLTRLGIRDYALHARSRGQNNDIVTIQTASDGTELVFRFPRHPRAIEELAREATLLRALHGRLPLPIPDPMHISLEPTEPGGVFMGYVRLPGVPLYRALLEALPGEGSRVIANQIGSFLVALHATPAETFDPPPTVANDRETWERMYADVRTRLFPVMRPDACQQVAAHFESYLDDAASSAWAPTLIHGDFGPSNILYDASASSLSGIIDWSSAGFGDPATDLAALMSPTGYDAGFADMLAAAYPPLAAQLPRANFYAGVFALQEALFGLDAGDVDAFEAGIAGYR